MQSLIPHKQSSNLMTRKQAASYLGVTPQTLAIWKSTGRYDLPVVKIGWLAKYRKTDLDKFIEQRTVYTGRQGG